MLRSTNTLIVIQASGFTLVISVSVTEKLRVLSFIFPGPGTMYLLYHPHVGPA